MRTLKVQGKGEITVAPDLCKYSILVSKNNSDYLSCYNELNSHVENICKQLNNAGISNEEIKTSNYKIEAKSAFSKKLGKVIPDGYEGSHKVIIEIPFDKERMNVVLKALSSECISDQSIRISFGIRDTEAVRKQLIRNAVAAAKINAETISEAAGMTLGQIVTIEYGWSEARFGHETEDLFDLPTFCRDSSIESIGPVFLPNDLTTTDTVNVVYEIV